MAKFNILIKKSASKELKKLPSKDILKVISKIESIADEPRPKGVEKLTSQENYRVRVGNYRIIYSIEDDKLIVLIIKISHRKDVYR